MIPALALHCALALSQMPIGAEAAGPRGAHAFVENLGQYPAAAAFVLEGWGAAVFAGDDGIRLAVEPRAAAEGPASRGLALFLTFPDGGRIAPEPLAQAPGLHHDFRGRDPARWVVGARGFEALRYPSIRRGCDLVVRAGAGAVTFDVVVEPGSAGDLGTAPLFEVAGADRLWLDAAGGVVAETALGPVTITAPVTALASAGGTARPIASHWEIAGESALRIVLAGDVAAGERVLIDPELTFATLLGGDGTATDESGSDILIGAAGSSIVVGSTLTPDYPVTAGSYDATANGAHDAVLTELTPDGTALVFSTRLGGHAVDRGRAVERGADGALYVVGDTNSTDFPITPGALDASTLGSTPDTFVAKLAADGSALIYSTFLGGAKNDVPGAIVVDPSGQAYVCGSSNSSDFPVTAGAYDTLNTSSNDIYVAKLNPYGGALVYATYLGASGVDEGASAIALAAGGELLVTGGAGPGFPVTAISYDPNFNGALDAFVLRLNASATGLSAGTFFGGPFNESSTGLGVGVDGSITICGSGTNVPTTPGAFDTASNDAFGDAYVARLTPSLDALVYSTYVGSSAKDEATGVAVDASGAATVIGVIANTAIDFPVTPDAFEGIQGRSFLARLDPTGAAVTYGTYVSSNLSLTPLAIEADAAGGVRLLGRTVSGFPTTPGAFDATPSGPDLFLAGFELCPGAIAVYGAGCPGLGGAVPVLGASGCPSPGFELGLSVNHSLGHTAGLVLLGLGSAPLAINGSCSLEIGPLVPSVSIPVALFGIGPWTASAVVPPVATPLDVRMQAVLLDPGAAGGIAVSNALKISIDS